MDPYKVLGVTPQTSDDDVKRAYRELARKYHPDNYVNNPLADLAEARMKEINEAYDTIMSERSGKTGAGAGSTGQTYGQGYGGQRTYAGPNAALYAQVRQAINQGNLNMTGGYGGYRPMQEMSACDYCVQLAICNCCCNTCLNGCCAGGGC